MARSTTSGLMPPGATGGGGATQLEFTQAMADFRVMFPDMEADVIEAVLRANHGAVDATIDNLLAMSADNECQRAAAAATAGGGPPDYPLQNPPSYQQATQEEDEEEEDLINLGGGEMPSSKKNVAEHFIGGNVHRQKEPQIDLLSDLDGAAVTSAAAGPPASQPPPSQQSRSSPKLSYTHPSRRGEHPRSLPEGGSSTDSYIPTQQMLQEKYEENLRQREEARIRSQGEEASCSARQQFLEDERLALMMQNEEFMAELRSDRDFMSALAAEDKSRSGGSGRGSYDDDFYTEEEVDGAVGGGHGGSQKGGNFQPYSAAAPRAKTLVMMDEALFREKLRNMGKTSKRKFAQLASMFRHVF